MSDLATMRADVAALREAEERLLVQIAERRNLDRGPRSSMVNRELEALEAQLRVTQYRREVAQLNVDKLIADERAERALADAARARVETRRAEVRQWIAIFVAIAASAASWWNATH